MANEQKTRTVEQTSKVWKLQQLLSFLCIFTGIIIGCASGENGVMLAVAFLLGFGGLAWFVFSRIGAWWFHG